MVHIVWYYRADELYCYITPRGGLADHSAGREIFVAKKRIILSLYCQILPPHCINIGGKELKIDTRHTRSSIIIVEPRSNRGYNRIGHMAASDYVVYIRVRDHFINNALYSRWIDSRLKYFYF
jgi:hypothetical protein